MLSVLYSSRGQHRAMATPASAQPAASNARHQEHSAAVRRSHPERRAHLETTQRERSAQPPFHLWPQVLQTHLHPHFSSMPFVYSTAALHTERFLMTYVLNLSIFSSQPNSQSTHAESPGPGRRWRLWILWHKNQTQLAREGDNDYV